MAEPSLRTAAGRSHVRQILLRIITAIQLTRLTMAFGAVSDLLFVILLTRGMAAYGGLPVVEMPLIPVLLAGAAVAIGLFAYGAALNDVLDVRHDTTFSPERPIPAGRIRTGQAIIVTVAALLVAILGAEAFGTEALWLAMLVAAAVLFYNAIGKYIPAVGVVTIGLIHAAHMLIPNFAIGFTMPVWLIMTHAMVIAAAVHVLEDKRPRFTTGAVLASVLGWLFWSTIVLGLGISRGEVFWPAAIQPGELIVPALVIVGFAAIVAWKGRGVSGRVAAEKVKRYGAMWQCLYAAAWLHVLELHTEAMWMALLAVLGFAAMTAIKEIIGLSGKPLDYRG